MQLLCEIEDVFEIQGRGCVIIPGIPYAFHKPVMVGAAICVMTPSGHELVTSIAGFEMINRGRPMEHAPFSVSKTVKKVQLPKGSRVFLVDE